MIASWFLIWRALVALAVVAGWLVMNANPGLACRWIAAYEAVPYEAVLRHHPACPPL